MSRARTRCTSSSYVPLQLPMVCSTTQLHRHATPLPFLNTPNALGRDRIVVPAGWARAKSRPYDTPSMRRRAGRGGTISCSSLVLAMEGAKQASGNSARMLLQDRGHEARPFHFNNNFTLIFAKNYDENARRADCDPHGILRSPVNASASQTPTARLVEPGFVDLLSCRRRSGARQPGWKAVAAVDWRRPSLMRQTTHEA